MKLLLSLSLLLSVFNQTQAFAADTNIVSANQYETTFVKISQLGDSSNPSVSIMACKGSPQNPSDCHSLGKKSTYTIAELKARRIKLDEEETGFAVLDVAVVAGSIVSGAAIFEGATLGISVLFGTSACTLVPVSIGAGVGAAGGVTAAAEVKKLNPMTEDREAASLVDVLNGKTNVKSIQDLINELNAALNF